MTAPVVTSNRGGSQIDALLRDANRGHARDARHQANERGVPTLLCASGRGGSGTSLVATLLAVAAAGDGYRVLLVDADDLVGPIAMLLGVKPRATWQDLRGGRVQPTDIALRLSTTLTCVAGGAARVEHGAASMVTATERKACMRRVTTLAEHMDLVVIDCGSRVDTLLATITPHANERLLAVTSGCDPIALAATFALCKAARQRVGALSLDVLVNRHEGAEAARCFDIIDAGARQFLGTALRFAGAVPTDPTLDTALRAGMSFPDAVAGSPAAIAAHDVVMRVLAGASLSRSGT